MVDGIDHRDKWNKLFSQVMVSLPGKQLPNRVSVLFSPKLINITDMSADSW